MKHPFMFAGTILLCIGTGMYGWTIGSLCLSQASDLANIAGPIVFLLTAFAVFKILKISYKKFA